MLEAALNYAGRGWHVFPVHTPTKGVCSCGDKACQNVGKHPRTPGGYKEATTDAARIRSWWKRWPEANIGIACAPSGLVVIDVDPRHGGVQTWDRIQGDHALRETPICATGGHAEGRHIYMRKPDRKLAGTLGPGVDVKLNGYVIAPPSLHASGRRYAWRIEPNGKAPIDMPDWVKPMAGITIEQTDPTAQACRTILDRWLRAVETAREGERNNTLNKAAYVIGGILHLGKLSESEVAEALTQVAQHVGLDETETERTIRSGLAGGKAKPLELDTASAAQPATFIPPESVTSGEFWGSPYTLRDAYAKREPLVYVVEGVLTAASVNIVFGDSGSLKSMLLADLCGAVAAGQTWLKEAGNRGGLPVLPGAAMWIDYDNGVRRTHERFAAIGRSRELPETAPLFYYSMVAPQLEADKSEHIAGLTTLIIERQVRLLVIDNLGLVSGAIDENSRDMARVIGGFRWLSEKTGACVCIIHHQNKPTGFTRKTGDMLRGHSSIKAGIDVALYILREGEGDQMSNDIYITAPKARDAEIHPFAARFNFEPGDRGELQLAWFNGIDWKSDSARKDNRSDDEVLEWLSANGPSSKDAIMGGVKIGWKALNVALGRLHLSGKLVKETGHHNSIIFRAAPPAPPEELKKTGGAQ